MWTLFYAEKKKIETPNQKQTPQNRQRTQQNTHGMMKRNNYFALKNIAQLQVCLPRFCST